MQKNYLGIVNTAITVIVLVVTLAINYEKQNTVSSTDIALIKQKVEQIEANIIELKQAVNSNIASNQNEHLNFEKRLIELEHVKLDNLRTSYLQK
jgi:predicted secreted Zn-dependent protease